MGFRGWFLLPIYCDFWVFHYYNLQKILIQKTSNRKTWIRKTLIRKTLIWKTSIRKTSIKKTSIQKTSIWKTSIRKSLIRKSSIWKMWWIRWSFWLRKKRSEIKSLESWDGQAFSGEDWSWSSGVAEKKGGGLLRK